MIERDYVLGTHDAELDRLALQHRVWRRRALEGWSRAGFTVGQTIIDIGSGPGAAAADLAEIVGPSGRIVALERSHRFLQALRERGISNIDAHELDLDEDQLPVVHADGAWARWVFSFVKRPRQLLEKVHARLKPGARIVLHEYMDYATWRIFPRSAEFEDFVRIVMRSWRAEGGEPDIAPHLALWLRELGFTIESAIPIVDVITPSNFIWQWPRAFVVTGVQRMVDVGHLSPEHGAKVREAFDAAERQANTLLVTPAVMEIVATRGH